MKPKEKAQAKGKGKKTVLLMGILLLVILCLSAWLLREHIRFFLMFEHLGKNVQGYPEYRHRKTGIVFVRLSGGEFTMGATKAESEKAIQKTIKGKHPAVRSRSDWHTRLIASELPQHTVRLSAFLIAKYELSQGDWNGFMEINTSFFQSMGERAPLERVRWSDAKRFCEKTGLKLPTEAMWEFACRAGTETPYAFGEDITPKQANCGGDGERTSVVDAFKPNCYGLYNMHGNVAEWCEDIYDEHFYSNPQASRLNPVCTTGSKYHVFRGGSLVKPKQFCRSASRASIYPKFTDSFLGEHVGIRPAFYPLP